MPVASRAKLIARIAVLVLGLWLIKDWQYGFLDPHAEIDTRYQQRAATGMNEEQKFVFFLHHLGIFPLATDAPIRSDTKEEAERQIREEMPSLKMDWNATFRTGGGRGRVYLYLWDVWRRGDSLKPKLEPAQTAAFTFALMLVWAAFWWMRRSPAGAALVVILGSNPFELFHLHKELAVMMRENIFAWPIIAMMLLLAINVPLMTRKPPPRMPRWYPYAAAVSSAMVLACVRMIRSDATTLALSVVLVCATCTQLRRLDRVKLTAAFLVAFFVANRSVMALLDHKAKVTSELLASHGGVPYNGPVVHDHIFWHAVFCGLGDYDKKYGYAWNDEVAYRYALPKMKELHPEHPDLAPRETQPWSYDRAGKYAVMFEEIPPYDQIIKEKVLGDIKKDPRWYYEILKKRARRILAETTPVAIAFNDAHYEVGGPLLGWLCLPLAAFLALTRRWFHLKLLAFSLPLSISALIIYSDKGMTFYGCYHLFGAFVFALLAGETAWSWVRGRRRAHD